MKRLLSSAAASRAAQEQWQKSRIERLRRAANIRNCENCSGDFLFDSRNCENCVEITNCEDCADLLIGYEAKDCRSCSNIYLDCQLNYEMLGSTQLYHCAFGFYVFRSRDVLYSEYIYDSHDLFGCVGITRGHNAILNQRYKSSEYQRLAMRLVRHMLETGEWGQTISTQYSPFGYNETVANDSYPLTEQQARQLGFLWRPTDEKDKPAPTRNSPPDSIANCSDAAIKEIYRCAESGEPFKIISPELAFYRQQGIALPTLSPRARHQRREQLRFRNEFRTGNCPQCGRPVQTNVPLELSARLRCEDCYQQLFSAAGCVNDGAVS